MSSGTHALGKRSVSPLYINKAQKKRRISSENSSPSFKVPIQDIPEEIWTVILFHIAPPQSYYNLCLVSKSFYNSIRHNELYWEFQCFHCLKVTKHSLYRTVANDGIEGPRPATAQRDAPSSLPSHQNSFPERGAQNAASPTPNPSASIPQLPTWFETYKFHHLRLMRPPSDEDWLSKANDLADQELFFYSLHFYNRALQNNSNDALTTACIGDLFYKHYLHRSSFDYLHAAIEKHDLSPEQAPWAYRQLSHLYRDALGTRSRNITKAVSLLKSSIELTNDVDAMYELGDLYDELRLKANAERKDHCKLFDESSSDDSHRSPNSNSPGSSSGGSSEDSSSTGKSVPSMVSSDSSTNRGSAPSMNSEPESGTANGEAQSLSDAGKSALSSDEARPMSTKSYNSAASSCPPESTSTPKTALTSSGEDSGAILSSDPSTTTQQLPNVRELKKRIGSSAQASGNQSSSSDSQSVAPKMRIRMKDRYRRNPSNSSRFLLRDSSSSSESSSPESDEARTLKGVNSEKLFKMAVHWFEMAASYGDTESMFELANMYPDTSPNRASWLKKAGDLGHKDALNDLAVMYELGQGGIQKDLTKAFEYYQQSAAAGSIDGMTNAGLMYEFGKGIQRDYARSIEMYKMAAEKGSARAMKNIGVMYELGRGVNRNYEQAVKWYQKAASHNETDAMVYLGTMAASGKGMVRDYRVALKWFRTVLNEHQDTVVYPYLGYMYIHGYGTKRRIQKGIQYLELSALKHEDATGQYMLGEVFHNGIPMNVEPDRTKAKELFEKAAKQEDQDATLHLSYYYSRGIACQKSEPKGHRIFEQVVEEIGLDRCLEMADNIFRGESMYMLDQEYAKFIWSVLAERMGNRLAKHRLMQAVQGVAANDENQ